MFRVWRKYEYLANQSRISGALNLGWVPYESRELFTMPLSYKINTELNLILYLGEGYASPSDFFALERAVFLEHPRPPGIVTLVDALELCTCFELADIRNFIGNIAQLAKDGTEPGPYIMLTRDRGLHLLAEAAQLLAGKVDLKARMYDTLEEAIVALGLSDHRVEIVQLWEECKLESSELRLNALDSGG